ncbi:hypothetical protein [Streptomyces sp. NRRL F-5630]|uniref:hypothetical protein n=1 Tax=Streptomyces sp. NRRL F-5630 TaxID=1463864 RepID=UPI003D7606C5
MSKLDDIVAELRASEGSTIDDETPEQFLRRYRTAIYIVALRKAVDTRVEGSAS